MLSDYNYTLPRELIAQSPASPRDAARLLVYRRKTKKIHFDTFRNLAHYLPPRAVLVFNQTKVVPARFTVGKPTGGKAVLTYLSHDHNTLTVLADRKLTIGTKLALTAKTFFVVRDQREQFFILQPSFPLTRLFAVLERYGSAPLPPYINHSLLTKQQQKEQYQTIFARKRGSIAAPTASLHFTKRLLADLRRAGIGIQFVTLHVNLGTFAPVTAEQLARKTLHTEHYEISPRTEQALNRAKQLGRPIVAVGTTVVRTLESASNARGELIPRAGSTNLFIQPNYHFKFVDHLITNFHVPRSSLMMLVAALTGRDQLLSLYRTAIDKQFHFYSFGDGMLIL